MFQIEVAEKFKTHILCSVTFFFKSCRFTDKVEEYCTAGEGTDENMARCMPDT